MWDDYKIFRVRVLLAFLKGTEDDHTVVKIAKTLNVTKQRVSRMLMELEKDGIIDRSNPRNPQLTVEGRAVANRYAERITERFHTSVHEPGPGPARAPLLVTFLARQKSDTYRP